MTIVRRGGRKWPPRIPPGAMRRMFFSDSGKFMLVDLETKIVYNLQEFVDLLFDISLPDNNRPLHGGSSA
jgi:hypothetical protein